MRSARGYAGLQSLHFSERLLKLLAEQLGLPVARIAMAADEPAKSDETQLASPSAKGAGGGGSPSKKVEGSDLPPDVVVPQLKLEIAVPVEGQGWRSLQREPIASFFARATRAHPLGAYPSRYPPPRYPPPRYPPPRYPPPRYPAETQWG